MKCPRCLSVCLDDDPICFSCHRPFVGVILGRSELSRAFATRMALIFLVFGTCLGPVVCRAYFPSMSRELFDFNSLAFAGAGAALGAMLGYALGGFLGGRER